MIRQTLAVLLVLPALAVAQDDPAAAALKKQKETAADTMQRVGVDNGTVAETGAIVLYTTHPEAKAKTLAAAAQKAYDTTIKLLKVEDKTTLWPGKLTAFVLPTRTNYNSFVRLILRDRPEAVESHRVRSTTDQPFVMVGVEPGTTATDASVAEEVSRTVADAVLRRKFGTRTTAPELPFWFTEGFGKLAVARADGNAAKLAALRAKQRAAFSRRTVNAFKVGDVWGADSFKDKDVLEISFVEFLLDGEGGTFDKFASAFKPDEDNRRATTADGLAALMWKDDAALDAMWKTWMLKALNK